MGPGIESRTVQESLQTARKPKRRIAITSAAVPPLGSGQATALGQLLAGKDCNDVILLSDFSFYLGRVGEECKALPSIDIRQLSKLNWEIPPSFGPPSSELAAILFALCRRAAEISESIRSDHVAAVVGCTGTPIDVPATALAAQELGIPFVGYLFDDPVYQWPAGPYRNFSAWQEMSWSARAAAVIVPNEFMAEEFNRRTGHLPHIIRNPVNLAAYLKIKPPSAIDRATKRIVYTGSIYHAQVDAFRNLVEAIGTSRGYEIHIYTSQSQGVLDKNGIDGKAVVHHPHVDIQSIPQIQKNADILFLPLAFHTDTQEVLRTSAPAKLGEYLAAGRPILVHAPRRSFAAHYIQYNNAGLVVDQPDPSALKAALELISTNRKLQQTLIENATKLSHDYDSGHVKNLFWSLIERVSIRFPVRQGH
jgi:glycosyltransferase involved in cell wall biosynthesis